MSEKKISKNQNLHEEHRARLRKRYDEFGENALSDIELLEMLLYYVNKRKDTRPVSQRLIETFGSLAGVFESNIPELQCVDGCGIESAKLITLCAALLRAAERSKKRNIQLFSDIRVIGEYGISLFKGMSTETSYAMLLTNKLRKIDCIEISQTPKSPKAIEVFLDLRKLMKNALEKNACAVVLLHNHPNGLLTPSQDDIILTHQLEQLLSDVEIVLLEHIIVTNNNFTPIMYREKGMTRSKFGKRTIKTNLIEDFYKPEFYGKDLYFPL